MKSICGSKSSYWNTIKTSLKAGNSLEKKLILLCFESTFDFLVTFVCFKRDSPSLVVADSSDGKCVATTLPIQDTNSTRLPLMVGKLCLFNSTRSSAHVKPCSISFSLNNSLTTLTNAYVSKLVKTLQISHFCLP
jgi:hypothetical protein